MRKSRILEHHGGYFARIVEICGTCLVHDIELARKGLERVQDDLIDRACALRAAHHEHGGRGRIELEEFVATLLGRIEDLFADGMAHACDLAADFFWEISRGIWVRKRDPAGEL